MKRNAILFLTLVLAGSAGCSRSSQFNPGPDGGSATGGGSGGTTGGFATTGPAGGGTGGFGTTGGTSSGGTTGGFATTGFGTTGVPVDSGLPLACAPGEVCCDGFGTCCFDSIGLCWSDSDGGTPSGPFPGGGSQAVETTDDPWEPPESVEVTAPSTSKPAWRESTEPLCTEQQGYVSTHALWSDERGVFVLVSSNNGFGEFGPFPFPGPVDMGDECVGCPTLTLWFNDGTGWSPYYEGAQEALFFAEHKLAGIPDGPLFAYGYGDTFQGNGCGLAEISESSFDCEPVWQASAVSVVNEELAYAIADGNLIRYQNGRWGPSPGVLNGSAELSALWADETSVFASTQEAGQWLQLVDGQWVVLDTGTLQRFSALWGHSATDVYAGTQEGSVFHYDGTTVSEVDLPLSVCELSYPRGVRGIWGAEGVTYVYTANQLVKLAEGNAEVVAEWPCDNGENGEEPPSIQSVWGNGPNEVFISLTDMRMPRQECGVTFVLYYDGSELHRL